MIVKSSDDPGEVCIPTRELPWGERAQKISCERVRETCVRVFECRGTRQKEVFLLE